MTRIFYLAQDPVRYDYINQIAKIGTALYGKLWLAGEIPQAEARFVTTTDIEPGVPPIVRYWSTQRADSFFPASLFQHHSG